MRSPPPQDDIEETVARLESRFGLPIVDGLVVENGDPARPEPAVLFAGRPATLLLAGAPEKIVVRGQAPGGEFRAEAVPVRVDFPLSALWARERIGYLEDRLVLKPLEEEALRPEILRLGLTHHLATRFTAFVAVERQKVIGTPGDVKEIVQPVELPQGWSESFRGGAVGGGFASTGAVPPPPAAPMPMPMRPVMMPSPRAAAMAPPPAPMMARDEAMFDLEEASAPPPSMAAPGASGPGGPPKGGLGGLMGKAKDMLSRKRSAPPPPPAEAEPEWDDEAADDVADLSSGAVDGLFESAREEKSAKTEAGRAPDASSVAAALAKSQKADGSYAGDALRTAAALLALVLLGNTRRAGPRSRVVMKAAAWLAAHRALAGVDAALTALEAVERGETAQTTAAWDTLRAAGAEGGYLVLVERTLA